jgi:hypothetical protein
VSTRIRIKVGQLEVEYDGTDEFIKHDLLQMVEHVIQLSDTAHLALEPYDTASESPAVQTAPVETALSDRTPNSVAAALHCDSGSSLLLAAAAYLTFVKGADTFDRGELLDTMREATRFYKGSYSNNLSGYLKTVLKQDDLRQIKEDTYSLGHQAEERLKGELVS